MNIHLVLFMTLSGPTGVLTSSKLRCHARVDTSSLHQLFDIKKTTYQLFEFSAAFSKTMLFITLFFVCLLGMCLSEDVTSLHNRAGGCPSNKYIVPGSLWLDTDGVLIQAHGAGMAKVDDTFYWFGEDHTPGGTNFQGYDNPVIIVSLFSLTPLIISRISVYSSQDLVTWKNEGHALSPIPGTQIASDKVGERPKVIFSPSTNQWIVRAKCVTYKYSTTD